MPDLEIIPTLPCKCISPGIIPILDSPGVIIPGQFGPINLTPRSSHLAFTSNISIVGIPSVMHTIKAMPDSAASRIEDLQNLAGTKIKLAVAPVLSTASFTVLNTGRSKWVCPPFPGVTPPTKAVP